MASGAFGRRLPRSRTAVETSADGQISSLGSWGCLVDYSPSIVRLRACSIAQSAVLSPQIDSEWSKRVRDQAAAAPFGEAAAVREGVESTSRVQLGQSKGLKRAVRSWTKATPLARPLRPRPHTATALVAMDRSALTDAKQLSTGTIFDELRETRLRQDRHAERVVEMGRILEQRGALKGGKDEGAFAFNSEVMPADPVRSTVWDSMEQVALAAVECGQLELAEVCFASPDCSMKLKWR